MKKARDIIEAETPKGVFQKVTNKELTVERIRNARNKIVQHYNTRVWDEVELAAASLRTGSEHEEEIRNDRAFCKVCGYVDDDAFPFPDPVYHPEFWR